MFFSPPLYCGPHFMIIKVNLNVHKDSFSLIPKLPFCNLDYDYLNCGIIFFLSLFNFIGHWEELSSLPQEVLTVSSATPKLGPQGSPGMAGHLGHVPII